MTEFLLNPTQLKQKSAGGAGHSRYSKKKKSPKGELLSLLWAAESMSINRPLIPTLKPQDTK